MLGRCRDVLDRNALQFFVALTLATQTLLVRTPRTQRKYRYLGSILEVNLEISLIHDRLQVVITAYSTRICSNADMCLERDNRALMSVR